MRFHVLGAGAVGRLFAAHLRQKGHEVTLLLRTDQKANTFRDKINGRIQITDAYRTTLGSTTGNGCHTWSVDGVDAEAVSNSLLSKRPIERLLVTTKAYDTVNALSSIWHRFNHWSVVILLGNVDGHC